MQILPRFIIFSSALALLTSCAPSTGITEPASHLVAKDMNLPNLQTYQASDLKDHPLACAGSGCNESVGQLVQLTATGFESCAFTLVSPTIILTAGHCVNWAHVNKDYSIQDGCFVRFAAKPGEAASDPELAPVACTAIVERTRTAADITMLASPDYAYIEIAKPSTRLPMTIAASPFAAASKLVDVTVIDPGAKADSLRSFSCTQNADFQLDDHQPKNSNAIVLPDCPIHFGNSGSPIFKASTHEILGVVSFISKVDGDKLTAVGSRAPLLLR